MVSNERIESIRYAAENAIISGDEVGLQEVEECLKQA